MKSCVTYFRLRIQSWIWKTLLKTSFVHGKDAPVELPFFQIKSPISFSDLLSSRAASDVVKSQRNGCMKRSDRTSTTLLIPNQSAEIPVCKTSNSNTRGLPTTLLMDTTVEHASAPVIEETTQMKFTDRGWTLLLGLIVII